MIPAPTIYLDCRLDDPRKERFDGKHNGFSKHCKEPNADGKPFVPQEAVKGLERVIFVYTKQLRKIVGIRVQSVIVCEYMVAVIMLLT